MRVFDGKTLHTNFLLGDTSTLSVDIAELIPENAEFAFFSGLAVDYGFVKSLAPSAHIVIATQAQSVGQPFSRPGPRVLLLKSPLQRGCLHSKILLALHPGGLRLAITSMNLSEVDASEIRQNIWACDLKHRAGAAYPVFNPPPQSQTSYTSEQAIKTARQQIDVANAAANVYAAPQTAPCEHLRAALITHLSSIFDLCYALGTPELTFITDLLTNSVFPPSPALPVFNTPSSPVYAANCSQPGRSTEGAAALPPPPPVRLALKGVSGFESLRKAAQKYKNDTVRLHFAASSISNCYSNPGWSNPLASAALAPALARETLPMTIAYPSIPFVRETDAPLTAYCSNMGEKPVTLPTVCFVDPEPAPPRKIRRAVTHAKVMVGIGRESKPLWVYAGSANISFWAWGNRGGAGASFEFGVLLPASKAETEEMLMESHGLADGAFPVFDLYADPYATSVVATSETLGKLCQQQRQGVTVDSMALPQVTCAVI